MNLRAVWLHTAMDTLGSCIVLAAGALNMHAWYIAKNTPKVSWYLHIRVCAKAMPCERHVRVMTYKQNYMCMYASMSRLIYIR
jgi:hypothetical protein